MSYKKCPFTITSEVTMLLSNTTSHYAVLGVDSNATTDQIKKAYRAVARQCHPDNLCSIGSYDLALAKEDYKRATYAYETLTDSDTRSAYDKRYHPTVFVSDNTFSYTGKTTQKAPPAFVLSEHHDQRLDRVWKAFISIPYGWLGTPMPFYQRGWFAVSALMATIVIICAVLGPKVNSQSVFWFVFATESAPRIPDGIPVIMAGIGLTLTVAISCIAFTHTVFTSRYSLKHNKSFWRLLAMRVGNLCAVLAIIFGTSGLLIGHYLF